MSGTGIQIQEPKGKLGVLLVGLGAVSTTVIAGVEAVKRGLAKPIGSLTQMGTIRLGKRTDNRMPKIDGFVPLAQGHPRQASGLRGEIEARQLHLLQAGIELVEGEAGGLPACETFHPASVSCITAQRVESVVE